MRIPTESNDESLFHRRGRRLESTRAARHVVRMIIVLILVIVVMNTASNEAIYRPFFPESPFPAEIPGSPGNIRTPTDKRRDPPGAAFPVTITGDQLATPYWFFPRLPDSQSPSPTGELTGGQRTLIESVVRDLPRHDRLKWALAINRFAVGHWEAPIPSSLALIQRSMEGLDGVRESDKRSFLQALEHLNGVRSLQVDGMDRDSSDRRGSLKGGDSSTVELSGLDQRWLMAMYHHLLRLALQRSKDGTVWRPNDRDALRLLLEQSKWDAQVKAPPARWQVRRVGVVPLLQQPSVYLGKRVRVQGSVARVESIEPNNTEESSDETITMPKYYQLWLRPRDGADRPLVAVVDRVPQRFDQLEGQDLLKDGPEVVIVGTYLKRLAYRSGKGADLAPVLVGALQTNRQDGSVKMELSEVQQDDRETANARETRQSLGVTGILGIVGAILLGLTIAGWIMWRTHVSALRTRQLRRAKQVDRITLSGVGLLFVLLGLPSGSALGQSPLSPSEPPQDRESPKDERSDPPTGLSLVSGFDLARLDHVYPFDSKQAISESAKLLDRLRRVSSEALESQAIERVSDSNGGPERDVGARDDWGRGDLVSVTGQLKQTRLVRLPPEVSEFLEFSQVSLSEYDVLGAELESTHPGFSPRRVQVLSLPLPHDAKVGDTFSVTGILVSPKGRTSESAKNANRVGLVCSSVRWYPTTSDSPSLAFLSAQGFDIALVGKLMGRDRKALSSADSDAFYTMLRIAGEGVPAIQPEGVSPVVLLRDSMSKIGELVSIPVETVQIIRVEVTEPLRQKQLGQNHYFQIDAMGHLDGAVRIEIAKSKANPDGGDVLFENRYPISIVTKRLPDFLRQELGGVGDEQVVLRDVRVQIQATGFFFRLWSYTTERMSPFGEKQQFGPLLIGARLRNLEPDGPDPLGIRWVGFGAAGLITISMIAIFLWHRKTSRKDALVRQKRSRKTLPPIE